MSNEQQTWVYGKMRMNTLLLEKKVTFLRRYSNNENVTFHSDMYNLGPL